MNNLINSLLPELESYIQEDGRVPEDLFFFISKHFGECCLELCVFNYDYINKKTKILLLPRPKSDPFWSDMLHIPGIRKIVTDTESSILARIIDETDLDIKSENIKYVNSKVLKNERGTEFSDLRCVQYFGELSEDFYNVNNLPHNIIPFQLPLIQDGLDFFMEKLR